MPRNTHFQDYWLTDPSFKFWVRKSDDKTKGGRVDLNDMQD